MGGSRQREGRIDIRVGGAILRRIEDLAAARSSNRSRVLIELIELGLEAIAPGALTAEHAFRRLEAKLNDDARFIAEFGRAMEQNDLAFQEGITRHLDRLTRLGVESVMILRKLAQLQGPELLSEAQQAAREFVRDRPATPLGVRDRALDGEGATG